MNEPLADNNITKQGKNTIRLISSLVFGIAGLSLIIIFIIHSVNKKQSERRDVISDYHDRSMAASADLMVAFYEVVDDINSLQGENHESRKLRLSADLSNAERHLSLLIEIQNQFNNPLFSPFLKDLSQRKNKLRIKIFEKNVLDVEVKSDLRQLVRITRQLELMHVKFRNDLFQTLEDTTKRAENSLFMLLFISIVIATPIAIFIISSVRNDIKFKLYTIKTLKNTQSELNQLAYYDPLTGLANRVLYLKYLEDAIKINARQGNVGALFFLDIDNFKRINDSLGHKCGDEVLSEVANILRRSVRETDSVSRLSGDEFSVLLNVIDSETSAVRIAENILTALTKPISYDSEQIFITVSIGIALFPKDSHDSTSLMKYADLAMYQSKSVGKNCFRFYNESLNKQAKDNLAIENRLRKAIENNEFELHYQPQYCLQSLSVIAVEALIRWNDPKHGLISPSVFIPIAETTGLIEPIGEWVIKQAASDLQALQALGGNEIVIALNVSARQLKNTNFYDTLLQQLKERKLEAANFAIEITESVLMEDLAHNHKQLKKLQEIGVGISIDDFGTGYSSFGYLNKLPNDTLKIDRSFIKNIDTKPKEMEIVSAMVTLAHNLNLIVVAEGVETYQQLELLSGIKCDVIQGFYYSKPKPLAELKMAPLVKTAEA